MNDAAGVKPAPSGGFSDYDCALACVQVTIDRCVQSSGAVGLAEKAVEWWWIRNNGTADKLLATKLRRGPTSGSLLTDRFIASFPVGLLLTLQLLLAGGINNNTVQSSRDQ